MTVFTGQKTTRINKGPGQSDGDSPFSYIGTGTLGAIKAHMEATVRVCLDENENLWLGFDSLRLRTYTTLMGSFFPLCFAWGNEFFEYNPKSNYDPKAKKYYNTFIYAGVTVDTDPSTAWSDLAVQRHSSGSQGDWSLSDKKSREIPLFTDINPSNYNLFWMGNLRNVVHTEEKDGKVKGYTYLAGTYQYASGLNDPDYADAVKIYFEGVEEFFDYFPWARYQTLNDESAYWSHNRKTPTTGSLQRVSASKWTDVKNQMPETTASNKDKGFRHNGTDFVKSPKEGKNK